jgi:hypothetical protein
MKWVPLTLLVLMLWTVPAPDSVAAADLSDFLPENTVWKPEGSATRADNESELFAAINGGAERYIRYGFKRALYQRFQGSAERRISLEIVEMGDQTGAKSLFDELAGKDGSRVDVGDEAVLHGYYLLFRKGPFYVSITATGLGKEGPKMLIETAGSMARRMETTNR